MYLQIILYHGATQISRKGAIHPPPIEAGESSHDEVEQMIAVLQTAALTSLAMESLVHEVRLELISPVTGTRSLAWRVFRFRHSCILRIEIMHFEDRKKDLQSVFRSDRMKAP